MRAVVQRVQSAQVVVDGNLVGQVGSGLLILVAAHQNDTGESAQKMADRVWGLRIFNDPDGKMNIAIKDSEKPEVLSISNFTLYGDATKGRRPSFVEAASFEQGKLLFDAFVLELKKLGCSVSTGIFGADMKVSLINDGPVTLILET